MCNYRLISVFRLCIIGIVLGGCSSCVVAQKNKTTTEVIKEFKEDYSTFRIKYEPEEVKKIPVNTPSQEYPKNHINVFLQEKLDSVYAYNEKITAADGFRILVYTGTSSEEARNQRNRVYDGIENEQSYTEWKSPNFKVKVGDYVDKLEAYYAYAKLIKVFPNAIVVPDKINILRDTK